MKSSAINTLEQLEARDALVKRLLDLRTRLQKIRSQQLSLANHIKQDHLLRREQFEKMRSEILGNGVASLTPAVMLSGATIAPAITPSASANLNKNGSSLVTDISQFSEQLSTILSEIVQDDAEMNDIIQQLSSGDTKVADELLILQQQFVTDIQDKRRLVDELEAQELTLLQEWDDAVEFDKLLAEEEAAASLTPAVEILPEVVEASETTPVVAPEILPEPVLKITPDAAPEIIVVPTYTFTPLPKISTNSHPAIRELIDVLNREVPLLSKTDAVEKVIRRSNLIRHLLSLNIHEHSKGELIEAELRDVPTKVKEESVKSWSDIAKKFGASYRKTGNAAKIIMSEFIINRKIDAENHRGYLINALDLQKMPEDVAKELEKGIVLKASNEKDPVDVLKQALAQEFPPLKLDSYDLKAKLTLAIRLAEDQYRTLYLVEKSIGLPAKDAPLSEFYDFSKWKRLAKAFEAVNSISGTLASDIVTELASEVMTDNSSGVKDFESLTKLQSVHFPHPGIKPTIAHIHDVFARYNPGAQMMLFTYWLTMLQQDKPNMVVNSFIRTAKNSPLVARDIRFDLDGYDCILSTAKDFDPRVPHRLRMEILVNFIEPLIHYWLDQKINNRSQEAYNIETLPKLDMVISDETKIEFGCSVFKLTQKNNKHLNPLHTNNNLLVDYFSKLFLSAYGEHPQGSEFTTLYLSMFFQQLANDPRSGCYAESLRRAFIGFLFMPGSDEFKYGVKAFINCLDIDLEFKKPGIDRSHTLMEIVGTAENIDKFKELQDELHHLSFILSYTDKSNLNDQISNIKAEFKKIGLGFALIKEGFFCYYRDSVVNAHIAEEIAKEVAYVYKKCESFVESIDGSTKKDEVLQAEFSEYLFRIDSCYHLDHEFNSKIKTDDLPYIDEMLWNYRKQEILEGHEPDELADSTAELLEQGVDAHIKEGLKAQLPPGKVRKQLFPIISRIVRTPPTEVKEITQAILEFMQKRSDYLNESSAKMQAIKKSLTDKDNPEKIIFEIGRIRGDITDMFYDYYSADDRLSLAGLKRPERRRIIDKNQKPKNDPRIITEPYVPRRVKSIIGKLRDPVSLPLVVDNDVMLGTKGQR